MDGDPWIWPIILQIILIALNAVFACAEIAVISMNDTKLEKLAAGQLKDSDVRSALYPIMQNQGAHAPETDREG